MKIVDQSFELVFFKTEDGLGAEKIIERCARSCYKSEDRIGDGSEVVLLQNLIERGHTAMLEFCDVLVNIVCDRGLANELVRHRIGSYAQESTRYCNYAKGKFGSELTVVRQPDLEGAAYDVWVEAMKSAENHYLTLSGLGVKPEISRSVLPIATKTEIWAKYNIREWMHVLNLRCSPKAHPAIRALMLGILKDLNNKMPILFGMLASKYLVKK